MAQLFRSSFKALTPTGLGLQNLAASLAAGPSPLEKQKAELEAAYKQAQIDKISAETTGLTQKNDAIGGIGDVFASILDPNAMGADGATPLSPTDKIAQLGPQAIQSVISAGGGNASQIGNSIGPVLNAVTGMVGNDEQARRGMVARGKTPTAAFALTPERADQISARDAAEAEKIAINRKLAGGATGPGGAKLKDLPGTVLKDIAKNRSAMTNIDNALAYLEDNKQATGAMQGLGSGSPTDLFASEGNKITRAAIADIGSQIIHERSGASVTISESPRLKPFIPSVYDDYATAKSKLETLKIKIREEEEAYLSTFGQAGYKVDPLRQGSPQAQAPTATPAAQTKTIGGKTYTKINGEWYEQ